MSQAITVERTGNVFSIAASEFLARFPDGTTDTFWSPPWHEMEPDEEYAKALRYARDLWSARWQKREEPSNQ